MIPPRRLGGCKLSHLRPPINPRYSTVPFGEGAAGQARSGSHKDIHPFQQTAIVQFRV